MSTKSFFTLLKYNNNNKTTDEILNQLKNIKNEYSILNDKNKNIQELETYVCLDVLNEKLEDQWINTKTKETLTELFSIHFNSSFTILIDHFDLTPYKTNKNQLVITKELAKEFVRDLEYLNSEMYSTTFEKILNSSFIEELGKNIPQYLKFKGIRDISDDNIDNTYNFNKRLLDLFNSYLLIDESFQYTNNKLILLYQVY